MTTSPGPWSPPEAPRPPGYPDLVPPDGASAAPTAGFSVPSPVVVLRRVTDDFPHLAPARIDYLVALLSVLWLFGSIMLVGSVAPPAKNTATVGAILVGLLLVTVVALRMLTGPALAVSPWGLWLRTRPGQAIWLPWPAIQELRIRQRYRAGPVLVVVPVDPKLGGVRLGVWTALVQRLVRIGMGRGFPIAISTRDRWSVEVLAMMVHYRENPLQRPGSPSNG